MKGIEAQRAKPPTQTRAIAALIGGEEQTERKTEEEKEKTRQGSPT